MSHDESGVAWSGWAHYEQGGFQGGGEERQYNRSGSGRASERLSVPTFSGEDSDDVGSSARSYLRQIEAWRRMTFLPPAQQGLVLYQHLSGKAWIAAEELSVPRLGAEGGVAYFVSWINARFLDLEVARIGKAFSDFFRRLKRRAGQSIREYNSEYDRLHARLREVGCSLPQECAAWLYIDRLQLEEAQELNLLASVGNEYNLHRLQQAAVLHDRGHRKPWETNRSRKPYSAHVTNALEDADEEPDVINQDEDSGLDDGVPEEVALAYATYQSAKDRYRNQVKNRGYQGERDKGDTKDFSKKTDLTRDEKVKLMKSRSFCSSCGKKGHWHRDPECPNNTGNGGTRGIKEVEVCHHVAAEVFSLRHEGASLLGITDTACAKAVAGTMWLQQYSDAVEKIYRKPELHRESEAFRFGTGKVHHSTFYVMVCFRLGNRTVEMRTSIINGDVPLLMSKSALAQLGMIYDVAGNRADFTSVGISDYDLVTTSSGHPAIPIYPAKPADGPERLVIGETSSQAGSQYTAYALSVVQHKHNGYNNDSPQGPFTTTTQSASSSATTTPSVATSTTKAPPFKIFHDKKISPEVKELLTQDCLHAVSFMSWWEHTKIHSDFWLESEAAWHRIHVVPRRALCNPSTWKTQHTVQKGMLLQSIGGLRVTEGFCCRTSKPLETAVDHWSDDQVENSFPLLWVGRSSFAKVRPSNPALPPRASTDHGMEAASDLEDVKDGAPRRNESVGLGGPSKLEHRGTQGDHHGAQDEGPVVPAGSDHEVRHQHDVGRAEDKSGWTQDRLPREDHERQPATPHPGRGLHPRIGADEDREVQGVRVPGDPGAVRHVGSERGENVRKPTCGVGALRQVVGREGVPEALRDGGHLGGERDGPLHRGRLPRHGFIDRGVGSDFDGKQGHHCQGSSNRPASGEKGSTELGVRPRGDECHGIRDRPGDPRGDPRAGDQAGDSEAEGKGRTGPLEGVEVKPDHDSLVGGPAPIKEDNHCEETQRRHGPDWDVPGRALLQDGGQRQGQVHPTSITSGRGNEANHYESKGNHFGYKTYGHAKHCCGGDIDVNTYEAYVTTEEFEITAKHQALNLECSTTATTAEDAFTVAYNNKDFQFETLNGLMNTLDYNPVRAARDGVFGGKTGDRVNYSTYGMFTHGGIVGVTTKTREADHVTRYLNAFGKYHLGPKASWTSISVSHNTATEMHHDFHNLRGSTNYSISLGQTSGGGLWLEDRELEEDAPKVGVKWRKTGNGQWLPGRVHNTKNEFLAFDPFLKHATEPWKGTRWSITFHTTRNLNKAGDELRKFLKNVGFPLPRKQAGPAGEVTDRKKPKMSTRRSLFNNAAKIGVMMTTLITAASSYMTEHVFTETDPNPVVMFEIGGSDATHDAAALGKDVFEPMTWERYRSPEGKDSAYHIINGGSPKELRVTLDGRPKQCEEALLQLIKTQIGEGGTVVISGPAEDEVVGSIGGDEDLRYAQKYHNETNGRIFMVLFKDKSDTQPVQCQDRVHEVRMVASGEIVDNKREQIAMGATGISFGDDVPKTVATALRRLHQNLGHPRQEDLLRHLRLAGCDPAIIKAARSMRCQVCDANAAPKIARPSTIPPMVDFNDTLGLDLFFCHDINDIKHAFLSVVDYGTSYHLATRVDGQSGEDIEAKFNEMWLLPFGPPKAVVIDLEGGLQSALGRLCDWHGVGVRERGHTKSLASRSRRKTTSMVEARLGQGELSAQCWRRRSGLGGADHQRR